MESLKETFARMNREEYGETYGRMRWVTEEGARAASLERAGILASLPESVRKDYCGTKIHYRDLSPGCRICGEGRWSCLFINSRCNGRCFYCPSPQPSIGEPVTNTISFPDPKDYGDYLHAFGFRGMSVSGGEPLLTFDRTLRFISHTKRRFGAGMHVWLYTNGILATQEKLRQLGEVGLDEIRFDLSANHYDLEKILWAARYIEIVTVEIPAIPEDEERLLASLIPMNRAGVKYLNLHQLRCTPHNVSRLVDRGYTFLHGPKVTVLESELTALRTLRQAAREANDLSVNYCSFVYKDRFQTAAYRRRLAGLLCKPYEAVTPAGLIRRMTLKGEPGRIESLLGSLTENGLDKALWYCDRGLNALSLHPSVWTYVDLEKVSVFVSYDAPQMKPAISYRSVFKEVALNRRKKVFIERIPARGETAIDPGLLPSIPGLFIESDPEAEMARADVSFHEVEPHMEDIREYEQVAWGLQEYL
jgi:pyruvate formate-lyase activating enzyme-like uncharacterized protein